MQGTTDGMTFVFFGIVGSGKGTQVKLLQEFLKKKDGRECVYAGTGEGFRKLITSGSYTGSLVNQFVGNGQWVPDFLTNALFTNILISSLTPEKHLIADGYPRTLPQSEIFDKMMKFYNRSPLNIIYIELEKDEAMRRTLLRGRHDDTKEGIEQRFDEFTNKVIPAINYFNNKENYKIHTINGAQSVEAVHTDIIKALNL